MATVIHWKSWDSQQDLGDVRCKSESASFRVKNRWKHLRRMPNIHSVKRYHLFFGKLNFKWNVLLSYHVQSELWKLHFTWQGWKGWFTRLKGDVEHIPRDEKQSHEVPDSATKSLCPLGACMAKMCRSWDFSENTHFIYYTGLCFRGFLIEIGAVILLRFFMVLNFCHDVQTLPLTSQAARQLLRPLTQSHSAVGIHRKPGWLTGFRQLHSLKLISCTWKWMGLGPNLLSFWGGFGLSSRGELCS